MPIAIDQLDRELAYHDAHAGYVLPDGVSLLLLVQLFPEDVSKELKIRHVSTAKDFHKTRDEVLNFANNERLADLGRGIRPTDVDSIREETWTTKEWMNWQHEQVDSWKWTTASRTSTTWARRAKAKASTATRARARKAKAKEKATANKPETATGA